MKGSIGSPIGDEITGLEQLVKSLGSICYLLNLSSVFMHFCKIFFGADGPIEKNLISNSFKSWLITLA